ncbi:MAG TPA: sigma-70 family RNA polymerase sigma factor [Terriglobales bacterium]|nr:sigma-70 family RNA polymerase sigma factor [Terriglobales bacterium]
MPFENHEQKGYDWNVYMGPQLPPNLYDEASLAVPSAAQASTGASRIEREVMELFDEFRNPLLRYSLSLGLRIHDAEEVIQEVFLALFRHLRLGRSRKNLRGWLFRVAHNLALKQRIADHASLQRTAGDASVAEEHADPAPGPEEQLTAAQRSYRLQAVVHALPENDQNCLRLRAEGLRYREIATVLGISLGAVSMSLTRSLARLARADGR